MYRIVVGESLDSEIEVWPEGTHYTYDSAGHCLTLMFSDPIAEEVESVQMGEVHFALLLKEGVVFLVFKFGSMPWSYGPYSWWLVSPEFRRVPEFEMPPESHALLTTILLDSDTGVVRALRVCTFSVEFTATLHQAIREQTRQEDWSPETHDNIIRRVDLEYLVCESMLHDAIITCKGGD
jgi:hypothetical protein